jgi:hypothetical protein
MEIYVRAVKLVGELQWRDSEHTCTLSDSERHLAHVFDCGGRWIAFNATRISSAENGPKRIGVFASFEAARQAVEACLGCHSRPKVRTAGN